jgi:DNA (cytosine-5)-methyltransferase 1
MAFNYGSVCSGVEAATVAWHPLGWQPQWFSEIEAFPSAVLNHHYPDTPNLGDMTKYKEWPNDRSIDLLVGGTPCQAFSVAGLRKGLDDPRGNLMLTYLAIAAQYQPKWLVWENVPGVLSSNKGRDFGTFLGALGKLGYGFAYRVLDAQYFGVAQRRRRVFVVGHLGDWRRAAAVLFERESLSGHSAPSREAREEAAGYTSGSFGSYSESRGVASTVTAAGRDIGGGSETLVAKCLTSRGGSAYDAQSEQFITEQENVNTITASYGMGGVDWETKPLVFGAQNSSNQGLSASTEVAPTLDTSKTPAVSYGIPGNWIGRKPENGGNSTNAMKNLAPNLTTADKHGVAYGVKVRRLTPKETERLQGFPDDYTRIPYRNKKADDCPDGPRYKAMGNSMAVPVMQWIGKRIQHVEALAAIPAQGHAHNNVNNETK